MDKRELAPKKVLLGRGLPAKAPLASSVVIVLPLIALFVVSSRTYGQVPQNPAGQRKNLQFSSRTAGQGLAFERVTAQARSNATFLARGKRHTLSLTKDSAVLTLRNKNKASVLSFPSSGKSQELAETTELHMKFGGAAADARVAGIDELPGKTYHANVNDRGPLTGNPTFRRVKYTGVYPGIDAVYYGNDRELEFDFLVAPHADPHRIRLSFSGADKIRLTDAGEISFQLGGEEIRLRKPTVYQEHDGTRREIAAAYLLTGKNKSNVLFRIGEYDRSLSLVIDPSFTFGSTNANDTIIGLETDPAGNSYVLGITYGTDFPSTQQPGSYPQACFLTKLSPDLSGMIYSVVFNHLNSCNALTLSPGGVPYFSAHSGFNLTDKVSTIVSVDDSSGQPPVINQFTVGNYDYEIGNLGLGVTAMSINRAGQIFLLGPCRVLQPGDSALQLNGFNVTPDPATCAPDNTGINHRQMLLSVVDATGTFLYGTLLAPGEGISGPYALADDDTGRAYVLGVRVSDSLGGPPFLTTPDAYNLSCQDQTCSYLMVVDTNQTGLSSLKYSSFLWGSVAEAHFVRIGSKGALYLASDGGAGAGFPNSSPPPPYQPLPQPVAAGTDAVEFARFDPDPTTGAPNILRYGYVYSPAAEINATAGSSALIRGVRVLPSGAVALSTAIIDPSATSPYQGEDVVQVFFPSGVASTPYVVGSLWEGSDTAPIAADSSGHLYLARNTVESTPGSSVSDIAVDLLSVTDPGANTPPSIQVPADFTVQAQNGVGAIVTYSVSVFDLEDGTNLSVVCAPLSGTLFPIGVTTVNCTVTDSGGLSASASFRVTVLTPPPNTLMGTSVTVSPIDEAPQYYVSVYQPVTLTFASVTADGLTRLQTRSDMLPPPPNGSQAGSPPLYFDLSTTAVYDLVAGIDACFDVRGMSLANPTAISLYLLQNGTWVQLPTASLTPGVQICTHVATLGSFAIFYPQVPQTKITTIAGTGFARNSIDGPGGDPRDDANDNGPAANAAITPIKAVLDRNKKVLYVSDLSVFPDPAGRGSYIRQIDLTTGIITTVVGIPELAYSLALDSTGNLYFTAGCQVRMVDFSASRVSIIAGTGTCGFAGDGLRADQAQIQPFNGQIALDRLDNLFIMDSGNGRVRRVDAQTRVITTAAGNGGFGPPVSGVPAAQTGFGNATGLAFDNQGHLLIANNIQLLSVSPGASNTIVGGNDEILTAIAGCASNCQSAPLPFAGDGNAITRQGVGFAGAYISVARDGAILVTSNSDPRIRRIDPGADGVVTGASDEIIWTVAGFHYPITNGTGIFNGDTFSTQATLASPGMAVEDLSGNLLIMDSNNNRLRLTGYSPLLPGGSPSGADLSITAVATPDPVDTGSLLTYGPILVSNAGPSTATGATLNFGLPPTATFQSLSTSQGACTSPAVDSSGTVNCSLGTLAQGATATVTVTVKPQTAGPLAATISVLGNEADFNASNNIANLTTTVNLGSAVINVTETITISDAPNVLPSAMIPITESIKVTDTPNVLPSAMIPVNENIAVIDSPTVIPQNMPPVVTPPASISIFATEIGGARGDVSPALHAFLLGGTAVDDTDPNPQRLAPQVDFGAGRVSVDDSTLFPVGTTSIAFSFRDKDGAIGTASATVTVTPSTGGIVGVGASVVVTPTDFQNVPQPLELTFPSILQQGFAYANPIVPAPAPPPGFQFFGPVYDITTTALFTPPVTVCFLGSGFSPTDQIWHAGTLLGSTVNTPTRICAVTNTLSPVGIVHLIIPQQQVVPPAPIMVNSPAITINNSAGDQTDPHVSKDLVTYTDLANSTIRYYRFSTSVDAPIPQTQGDIDILSDVSGDLIAFSRIESDRDAIMVFNTQTSLMTEIDPHAGTKRLGTAIGGNTVAFIDLASGQGDVYAYDLGTNTLQLVSGSPYKEQNPNVSPDGNTIVWEQCQSLITNCDTFKSARTGGVWGAPLPISNTPDPEGNPDTDGTWIAYDANHAGNATGRDIYYQPVGGGIEYQLALPGDQRNPSVSKGFIGFESGSPADLFVYDIARNSLYQVTSTATLNETLNNISVLDNGDIRVVWAADDGPNNELNIYATTFTPVGGSFTSGNANLTDARYGHTATLLNNGLVLIAGGKGNGGALAGAELYDPIAGTFTQTGSMNAPREGHTATLLSNGKVLIAGGSDGASTLASAELYDPVTAVFTAAGNLTVRREGHTATLLNNGKVLFAGGGVVSFLNNSFNILSSAELYDPATGISTFTGNMTGARINHTATLLNNGLVLIAAGVANNNTYLQTAELYDPGSGTFTVTGGLAAARGSHTAMLLNDGRALVAGGVGSGGRIASAELYDPATNLFATAGSMTTARSNHTATLLNNGLALILGGLGTDGVSPGAELFSPSSNSFIPAGTMSTKRASQSATLLNNGKVFIAAGFDGTNPLANAELYQPNQLTPPGLVSIAVAPVAPTIGTGASQPFVATGTFSDGSFKRLASATWSSSDTTIATITNDPTDQGIAYAVGAGSATITACTGAVCGSIFLSVATPQISLSATSLTFTDQVVGTSSASQTVTLTNTGTVPVVISSIVLNNPNPTDFPMRSTCPLAPTPLAPSLNCSVTISFQPAAAGLRSASISINDSAAGSPHFISLAGNGIVAPTTTLLASSVNSSAFNQPVTLTATVNAAGLTPTGTITFLDGATTLTSVPLSGGTASLSTSAFTVGTHSITAAYSGDSGHAPSVSTALSQVVKQTATATGLTSSQNPQLVNRPITLVATVTGQFGGLVTGSVSFKVGSAAAVKVAISGGQANYTTSFATAGTRSVTATCGGDTNNAGSTSLALSQSIVLKFSTATVLVSSLNPSLVGQGVTFTATVSSPGGVPPDGEPITFKKGTTTLATVAMTNGSASFTTSTLAVGTNLVTASYGGDTTFSASTSSGLRQVVNKYSTLTSLTSSLNPSVYGQSVTFTATVSSTGPNTPTGSVTFKNGSTSLATVTLSGGLATLMRTNLPTGTLSLTATYNSDSTFAASTSAPLNQVVNQAVTKTIVSSSRNPSTLGQSVRFVAVVSNTSSSVTPTGSVTFYVGSTMLGQPVTLSGGKATSVAISTLPIGSTIVTAVYVDGVNFVGGSGTVTQGVN